MRRNRGMTTSLFVFAAASLLLQTSADSKATTEGAIATVEQRFDQAIEKRDRNELESVLADPFIFVHAGHGNVDSRSVFIENAVRGLGLARQGPHAQLSTFERILAVYGNSAIVTLRRRIRFPDEQRDLWFRQSSVYVRDGEVWKLAMGHGTLMYDGPITTSTLYGRYAGTYVLQDGRTLKMEWDGDSLIGTLPGGTRSQIFLKSPTEEASERPNRLAFVLDKTGHPTTVRMMNGATEGWRAEKK